MTTSSTPRAVAEEFLAALAQRDYDAMARSLHPEVAFRALLPSRLAELDGSAAAIDEIRGWFGDAKEFTMVASGVEDVEDRARFWCKIELRDDDGWAIVEQTGFCDTDGDALTLVNLVCSGWRAIDRPHGA